MMEEFVGIVILLGIVVAIFVMGAVAGSNLNENDVHDTVVLMLKDPAPAQEILRSGKRVILLDGGFAPGKEMIVTEYKELMTYVE